MADPELINAIEDLITRQDYGGPLNELRTREFKSFFNHMFASIPTGDGFSTLWFDEDTSSGGAINRDGADAVLHCNAATNEHAQLETTENINYSPGTTGAIGWAMRPQSTPSGDQDEWIGATNGTDGVGTGIMEFDVGEGTPEVTTPGVQPYIFFEKTGQSRLRIPQEHWNRDTLDGSGGPDNPSGETINDLLDGLTVRIDPQLYYGQGIYSFGFLTKSGSEGIDLGGGGTLLMDDAGVDFIEAHRIVVTGNTMLEQPNVPIRARAETNGTAQAIDLNWTAVHYERARKEVDIRLNGETRRGVDVDAAWEPLISWRKRSGWEQVNSRPLGVVVSSDTDLTLDIQLGTGLNGASFALPTHTTSSEAALEFDVSATGFSSTGERRWIGQVSGGGGSKQEQASGQLTFNLPGGRNVTLAAKADAANATVDAVALAGSEF